MQNIFNQITFQQMAYKWLYFKKTEVKISSYNKYKNVVEQYLIPTLGPLPVSDITDEMLLELFRYLQLKGGCQEQGLSAKTRADILSVLRGIFQYAKKEQLPLKTTAKELSVHQQKKPIRVLTSREQMILTDALIHQGNIEEQNLKDMGILLCLYSGLRIGELCALGWDDISLEDNTIYVHRTMQRIQSTDYTHPKTKILISTPKSLCSIRTIPLNDEISKILQIKKGNGYILTGNEACYIEPRIMQSHYKKLTKKLQIKGTTFHTLRHTFATRCVELGFDIKSLSEILGHSSVTITMNRYVHPSMELKRQNMQLLSPYLKNPAFLSNKNH